MKYILLLSLIFTVCYSATSFSYTGNVTMTNPGELSYRFVSTSDWSLLLFSGAYFISGSVDITKTPISANFDLLEAACYTGTGSYPVFWLTYFDESVSAKVNLSSSQNWASVDVSAARGFVGLVFLSIDEIDPSTGKSVNTKDFSKVLDVVWTEDGSAKGCDADKNLCWVGYNGKVLKNIIGTQGALRLQYVASRVLGKISGPSITDLTVGPRSIESIFYIDSWDYAKSTNYLTLNMALASAQVTLQADGTLSTSAGGNDRVYVGLAKTANVSGTIDSVTISAVEQVALSGSPFSTSNPALVVQATAKYGASAVASKFSVSFPPGATNIVYDPTVGSGVGFSSSVRLSGATFLALVAMLLGLFFKQ